MSCTAAVDLMQQQSKRWLVRIRLSTISEEVREMTTNVQRQRWRKENNKDTFRMKSFKIILAVFLLSIGINAQTETLINKVYSGHDITISWN
jgi:hypothetical protein